MRLTLAALIMAIGGAALAQTAPMPPRNCYPFACPPRPMPPKPPSQEALALGRLLVGLLDGRAVWERTHELIAMARAKEGPRPARSYPNGPIRAQPPSELADYPSWGTPLNYRVVDHAALAYARKYPLDQLRQMVDFFESPAGRTLLTERQSSSAEIKEAIASPLLEHDLWNLVCSIPVPSEVEDGPHHFFHDLHPPFESFVPPAPASWCARVEVRSRYSG